MISQKDKLNGNAQGLALVRQVKRYRREVNSIWSQATGT